MGNAHYIALLKELLICLNAGSINISLLTELNRRTAIISESSYEEFESYYRADCNHVVSGHLIHRLQASCGFRG